MCLVQLRVFAFLAAGPVRVTVNSGPSALLVWLSVISTVATVAAVFFAWRAAHSAREANRYARETVEVAEAAREADQRDRRLQGLREIGRLVERIARQAGQTAEADYFRVTEQNQLAQALIGIYPPMQKCARLVQATIAGQAYSAAQEARAEVQAAIASLRAEEAKGASAPSPPTSA